MVRLKSLVVLWRINTMTRAKVLAYQPQCLCKNDPNDSVLCLALELQVKHLFSWTKRKRENKQKATLTTAAEQRAKKNFFFLQLDNVSVQICLSVFFHNTTTLYKWCCNIASQKSKRNLWPSDWMGGYLTGTIVNPSCPPAVLFASGHVIIFSAQLLSLSFIITAHLHSQSARRWPSFPHSDVNWVSSTSTQNLLQPCPPVFCLGFVLLFVPIELHDQVKSLWISVVQLNYQTFSSFE